MVWLKKLDSSSNFFYSWWIGMENLDSFMKHFWALFSTFSTIFYNLKKFELKITQWKLFGKFELFWAPFDFFSWSNWPFPIYILCKDKFILDIWMRIKISNQAKHLLNRMIWETQSWAQIEMKRSSKWQFFWSLWSWNLQTLKLKP